MNYFYEQSKFSEFKSDTTYHQLLSKTDDEFVEWARLLRKEVTDAWDGAGQPPVKGKTEESIIKHFGKLKNNDCDFFIEDTSDDESLGILKNFNKDQSVVNQFFPTMLKTRISNGVSADGGLSIYDYFAQDDLEDAFVKVMRRAVKRDSMYAWSRSLTSKRDENPFWNGQTPIDFIKDISAGKIFTGKWKNFDIVLTRTTIPAIRKYGPLDEGKCTYGTIFFLDAKQVNQLVDGGYLNQRQISNCGGIEDSRSQKNGKVVKYLYNIRWYNTEDGIFPRIVQAFRLGLGQPAVNFPALTAKWIYENYTNHIEQDEPLHIYDSSAGWGGRIAGAMSSRKKTHYIGTDPNPDNFIPKLGISRYEYMANYYNKTCIDTHSDVLTSFFEVKSNANTFELFQDGSELIHNNPDFQKYKGKLDLSFTSPPYFNREQYSQDENQSFIAYSQYDDWRENFLKPTLTTIYEYSKSDRYILWNIASIKVGKDTYFELEEDSIKILKELGAEYKGKLKMCMAAMIGANVNKRESVEGSIKNMVQTNGTWYKYEPIFVFHKK
jgi:hypothetical protein|tara:strand:- start:6 stop:1652 length:1647 start_codon:yes stop_codon:yes gene_type:complete